MTLLVLTPPPQHALTPGIRSEEWSYGLSRDGLTLEAQGSGPLTGLPRADRVVVVLDESSITWIEVPWPKVTGHRLRAALVGLVEEQLLDEAEQTHLALGPWADAANSRRWVAAVRLGMLQDELASLRAAGLEADAVVAAAEPAAQWRAHARLDAADQAELVLCGPQGVSLWPLDSAMARTRLPSSADWTAEPAAAPALRDALSRQAPLVTAAQRALRQATQGCNLLQFDLAPRLKASRALRTAWDQWSQPRWRWLHRGLIALVLVQVVGLNMAAWRAEREVQTWNDRGADLLQATFPGVKVVVDAPLQMRRELDALRQAAGEPGPTDLDAWLDVLARHWPAGTPALASVRLDRQALVFESAAWPESARAALAGHAARHGWTMQDEGPRLRLSQNPSGR